MQFEHFEIAERFCGPPRSANGGYTCGLIARHLKGSPAIRLKVPPPVSTPLRLEYTDHEARLFNAETLVGEARPSAMDLHAPSAPAWDQAVEASRSYAGFHTHPFSGCFVCGPGREAGDGLRIFPGPVPGSATLAAPWIPDVSLADGSKTVNPEFLWSALDCTGAFAIMPAPKDVAVVLGELSALITGDVAPGERCVVTGWPLAVDGRKRLAGSAVYAGGGRLVALARAVWIEVPLRDWQ